MCNKDWSLLDNRSIRPSDSYFVMIGKAIISSPTGRMALYEIYNYIIKNYPYFKTVNPTGWKNSVRHNLSLHECFIKVGKCEECKGHYWGIHPANVQDFSQGDFHRRKAKAKARFEQAREKQKVTLLEGMPWDHHYYSTLKWPSTMYSYYYPWPLSSNSSEGALVCEQPTSDKLLKFNISNLIDIR